MKIIIAGATGFIGSALTARLSADGHALTVLTRTDTSRIPPGATRLLWRPGTAGEWERGVDQAVADAEGIINLAGESIAADRWTEARKRKLRASRVETTRALVDAIAKTGSGVKFLLNASAVGYYGPHGDETVTEADPPGGDFLARLCRDWEAEALRAEASGVRVVLLRTGIVLGKNGGALAKMVPPFKFFLGGPLGSGKQWMPWIHLEDEIGLIALALTSDVRGALNATAPEPVTMKGFCQALGQALGRPCWAPVPAFVLRVALGEMSDMLLTGQRAVPAQAERLGYRFRYPKLPAALENILTP
jgi:uncharacterized protein (TIGR01777 family)